LARKLETGSVFQHTQNTFFEGSGMVHLFDVLLAGGFDVVSTSQRPTGVPPRPRKNRGSGKAEVVVIDSDDSDCEDPRLTARPAVVITNCDEDEQLSIHHATNLTHSCSTMVGGHLAGVEGHLDGTNPPIAVGSMGNLCVR